MFVYLKYKNYFVELHYKWEIPSISNLKTYFYLFTIIKYFIHLKKYYDCLLIPA